MDPLELKGRYIHCDLNVPRMGQSPLKDRLRMISELGWECVAISTYVPSGQEIPKPIDVKETFGMRVFHRVTVRTAQPGFLNFSSHRLINQQQCKFVYPTSPYEPRISNPLLEVFQLARSS